MKSKSSLPMMFSLLSLVAFFALALVLMFVMREMTEMRYEMNSIRDELTKLR